MLATKRRKGQLRKDGSLGRIGGYQFIDQNAIIERLIRDEADMSLTIGLSFRDPKTNDRHMDVNEAVAWLTEHGNHYVFEALYDGDDDVLHVTALYDNDLC